MVAAGAPLVEEDVGVLAATIQLCLICGRLADVLALAVGSGRRLGGAAGLDKRTNCTKCWEKRIGIRAVEPER